MGKTCLFPPALARFTNARVRIVFGLLRPKPDYPTPPAFYPASVRQVRVLPPVSFRLHLAATPLPSSNSSDYHGLSGTFTP